jgi:DNA polymerase-1
MLEYCRNDVDITVRLYKKFLPELLSPGLDTEHRIQWLCQRMHENGFEFNKEDAQVCLSEVQSRMAELESRFQIDFPPQLEVVNELKNRRKKDGRPVAATLKARRTYPKTEVKDEKLLCYDWVEFKPGSPKDRIDRLWEAGWQPTEKTKGHILYLREGVDIPEKKERFERYGWMCNETNLATLPDTAPDGAKGLAEWLTLEGRRSSLEEWIGCEARTSDGRIHGRFQHIGAWTGRMAHSSPNQANIPAKFHGEPRSVVDQVKDKYDGRLRSLFVVPSDCYLVGTDAEGIQLRVLAHLMKSEEYVEAIVSGKKEDETDIHNVNRKALGMSHVTRDMAKTFIYAFLLGAGVGKISEILRVNTREAGQAVDNFTQSISGLAKLKNEDIPKAAAKGYFIGLDGRKVKTPSQHKTLAGMLQNGEAVVMKHSALQWTEQLDDRGIDYKLVTWPHDEWQTEVKGDRETAETVGLIQRVSIETTGTKLGLFCPLAGSSDIGKNWGETH